MEYIRTKYGGLYRVYKKYEIEGPNNQRLTIYRVYKNDEDMTETIAEWDILRTADTIEKLCDEFVIKMKQGFLIIDYYKKKLLTQDAKENGADSYGAIWTDKGLIYVAKMNEKGEWELLW